MFFPDAYDFLPHENEVVQIPARILDVYSYCFVELMHPLMANECTVANMPFHTSAVLADGPVPFYGRGVLT